MRHVEDLFEMRLLSPTLEELNNCEYHDRINNLVPGKHRYTVHFGLFLLKAEPQWYIVLVTIYKYFRTILSVPTSIIAI